MLLNKKEIELATQLKNAGLEWQTQQNDLCLFHRDILLVLCIKGTGFIAYLNDGEYEHRMGLLPGDVIWLPTLQQCIDGLRSRGYHIVEYREVQDANLVLVGINKDLTTIHDYTVEAKTDLEAMYKLLLEVIKYECRKSMRDYQ